MSDAHYPPCDACDGTGRFGSLECPRCHGHGYTAEPERDGILDGRLLHPKTPHRSRFVASKLTDDFLQRLINCIEEPCAADAENRAALELCIAESVRGDDFLAYTEVKQLFRDEYPDLYEDEE